MKGKVYMDAINKLKESLKSFIKNFKFTEDVYVESKEGEQIIVNKDVVENAQKIINELQKSLDTLTVSTQNLTRQAKDELLSELQKIEQAVKKGNPEIISVVAAICEKGLNEIDKLGTLNVAEFKTPEQLRADKIARGEKVDTSKSPHGGDIAIISTKGYENQPKSKDNSNKNKIGAGMVGEQNAEYQKALEGEHVKKEKVVEIINGIAKASLNEIEKIEQGNGIETQDIKTKIKENMDKIAENVEQSSSNKPEKITGKIVTQVKRLTKKALVLIMIGNIAISGITGYSLNKDGNYSIGIESQENKKFGDDTNELEEEARESIEEKAAHEEDANKEEIDNGSIRNQDSELLTRESETESYDELNETLEEIESLKETYNQIKNPTNLETIEYQENLLEKEIEIINIIIEAKQGDNKALDKWIQENNEHISRMQTKKDIEEHKTQNENSEALKIENNNDIKEFTDLRKQKEDKMKFFDKIELLPGFDNIKNIENFSESVYEFYNENKNEISSEQLMEFLNKKGMNLDLFAAYTNSDIGTNDLENFFSNFYILHNTYDLYVEEYCNGDDSKADPGKYVNYFNVAQKEYMEELGDTEDGLIGRFWQKLEQNKMNKRFFEQTTGEQVKFIENFVQFAKTIIDVSRDGELKETLESVEKIQNEKNIEVTKNNEENIFGE